MARHDKTDLPGFEENDLAQTAHANTRALRDLLDEWTAVQLLRNLIHGDMLQIGTASGHKITPFALGFVIIGHPLHHFKVIQERYMNRGFEMTQQCILSLFSFIIPHLDLNQQAVLLTVFNFVVPERE